MAGSPPDALGLGIIADALPGRPRALGRRGNALSSARAHPATRTAAMKCRVCGCTDGTPCVLDEHNELVDVDDFGLYMLLPGLHQCSWIEPDLCSGCIASS